MNYPLAKNGVFLTIQGEGVMIGQPMIFVRLAGCSVGCALCDTDYKVSSRATAAEIVEQIRECAAQTYSKAVWITGGEPLDHDLEPLVSAIRDAGFWVSIATSGHIRVPDRLRYWHQCRICVSPHDPAKWVEMVGDELNIVPGLAGHSLAEFVDHMAKTPNAFRAKRVTPCDGIHGAVAECVDFVAKNCGWTLGVQAHKSWGVA